MKTVKFSFIGCGKIANAHADVIKHLGYGIDIVVSREGSKNIENFANRYGVKHKVYGIDNFLKYCSKSKNSFDAIMVCTPWDVTHGVLMKILPLDIPIMAEKPAVLSLSGLNALRKTGSLRDLFPAYNRKFYDFIPSLKDMVENENPIAVDILSAEPFEMIIKNYGKKIGDFMPYFYSSHIIDLMFHLFGEIEIKDVYQFGKGNRRSFVCALYSKALKCQINMKILMDCPQNSYMKIFFDKEVVELKPLEKMAICDKLERKELEGRRTYAPRIKLQVETDATFKAGFLNQTKYFIENFVYKKNNSLAHIERLEKVTYFCGQISKIKETVK